MKALKLVLLACSLSVAALAHAQTAPADESAQQVAQAQANPARVAQPEARHHFARPAKKENECVGPVSYCVMYFGS
jgi:hypothetical protein